MESIPVYKVSVKPSYLTCVGDPNSPITWSGTTYHFLQEARRQGLVDAGLPTGTDGVTWRARRTIWNALQVLQGEHLGGYQYSVDFLEKLFAPFQKRIARASLIHCFQLLPPSVVQRGDVEKWCFIDQTLRQLFTEYGVGSSIGRRIAREALDREREGYRAAAGVIMHSSWAARSVVDDYGVDAEKVHAVVPGANVDTEAYQRWEQRKLERERTPNDGPLRLVFVGKYWHRKGLDRLLAALEAARDLGLKATLRVIGCPKESVPPELRRVAGVEWIGFVDKRREIDRFLDLVGECDVGCLLSRAEAGGVALREYAALGLLTLGTDVGGAGEHAGAETSVLIGPTATAEMIGRALFEMLADRAKFQAARKRAWETRATALWAASVIGIRGVLEETTKRRDTAPTKKLQNFEDTMRQVRS